MPERYTLKSWKEEGRTLAVMVIDTQTMCALLTFHPHPSTKYTPAAAWVDAIQHARWMNHGIKTRK